MTSTVVASKDQLSADLGEEAAILNMASGVYFGLEPVGAWIWKKVQQPVPVSAVAHAMLEEFDVELERCQADLSNFLTDLRDNGLLEERPSDATE